MNEAWLETYMQRYYRSKPSWKDGTHEFHEMCSGAIKSGGKILEVGAGPTNPTSAFLARLGELYGADIDPEAAHNSALKGMRVISEGRIDYPDSSFDACVSNYVLEHVEDPSAHMREIARVLKPGGVYIFRTPNQLHYTAIVSRFTPHSFHVLIANRLRNYSAEVHDPWPTFYRLNSKRAIARHAGEAALAVEQLRFIEKEPSYGFSSRMLFLLFMLYERFVNSHEAFRSLRGNIWGVLRKGSRTR